MTSLHLNGRGQSNTLYINLRIQSNKKFSRKNMLVDQYIN